VQIVNSVSFAPGTKHLSTDRGTGRAREKRHKPTKLRGGKRSSPSIQRNPRAQEADQSSHHLITHLQHVVAGPPSSGIKDTKTPQHKMGNSESRPRRNSSHVSSTSAVSSFERLPLRGKSDKRPSFGSRRTNSDRSLEIEEEAPRPLRVGYPYYEEVRHEVEMAGRRKRGLKRFSR
jgi:hypothetical protein